MKNKKAKKIALVTGLALAGAGAAYLYGTKDGKKKRKEMEAWVMKAKKEVMSKAKKINNIKKTAYDEIVKNIVDSYSSMKDVNKKELKNLATELRSGWKHIQTEAKGVAKKAKTTGKKVVKKAVKKITKKMPKRK